MAGGWPSPSPRTNLRAGLLGFGGRFRGGGSGRLCWGRLCSRGGSCCAHDCRGLDDVETGPLLVNILLAALGDVVLVHSGGISVLVVEHFHNVHPRGIHNTEGSETLGVQIRVVLRIDE